MLLTHLLTIKNKLHTLVDAYNENPVLPDDMNLFVALQLVHKLGHGQCHALTLALHDFTGLPIYLLVDNNGQPMHSYVKHENYSLDGYLLSDEHITISFYESIGAKNGCSGAHPIMVTHNQFLKYFEDVIKPQREMLAYFDALMDTVGIEYSTFNQFLRKAS
jgi:hypothetical protein